MATAGDGLFPNTCTLMRYSIISLLVSLSLNQKKRRKSLSSSFTTKLWNICSMSAVTAISSLLKRSKTPKRLLFKSGPERRTSFKEMPCVCALESKTTLIWPGFCGWYTPKIGKYQYSWPSRRGGTTSAWSRSKMFCMKVTKWDFISGFFSNVRNREVRRVNTWSLLLGSRWRGVLNGSGATQLLLSSINISLSMISRKHLSSIDNPTLLSSFDLSKIVSPMA